MALNLEDLRKYALRLEEELILVKKLLLLRGDEQSVVRKVRRAKKEVKPKRKRRKMTPEARERFRNSIVEYHRKKREAQNAPPV